jgi:hypothetical protein
MLFEDQAAATWTGFVINSDNEETVAPLCQRLDGLPLAIELAAVRERASSVEQILTRVEDRYRLLTAGDRRSSWRSALPMASVAASPGHCGTWPLPCGEGVTSGRPAGTSVNSHVTMSEGVGHRRGAVTRHVRTLSMLVFFGGCERTIDELAELASAHNLTLKSVTAVADDRTLLEFTVAS